MSSTVSNLISVEISQLTAVGTDTKLVLLDSVVLSESIVPSFITQVSTIISPHADGTGALFIANDTECDIWYAVGASPNPSNAAARRLLRAGKDASIAIKQNDKVAVIKK